MRISDWSSDVCSSDLPLAGPVTAGAAWLDAGRLDPALACRIDDSKKLTPQTRREIFAALSDPADARAVFAVGEASVGESSEERRVGQECVSMCRSRGEPPD